MPRPSAASRGSVLDAISPEGIARTAAAHAAADAKLGRDWLTGGCTCGACRISRRQASAASRAAAALGRIRSPAKAAASRANGRLSKGRPRVPRCPECQRRETEPHKAACSWMPR